MSLPTMKMVRPAAIGDAQLAASNVLDAPAAWSGPTIYALGDQATVASGTAPATVYESLQDDNLNHAPASSPTWWRAVSTIYLPHDVLTNYTAKDRATDAATHTVYESVAGGSGHALTDTANWLKVGPTNRWAMFDGSNTTQTVRYGQITATVAPAGRVDSVGLFNVDATSVRIVASAATGVVYDKTYDLTSVSGIDNWYDWFSEPIERVNDLVVTDLPAYSGQTITVTVDAGSATAKVGTLVVGLSQDIGMTLADAETSIIDYSKKVADDFGNYVLQVRSFSKKVNARIVVENDRVDQVQAQLAKYRAVPLVWTACDRFASLAVFGFIRSFSNTFSYPDQSVCALEIEGIT